MKWSMKVLLHHRGEAASRWLCSKQYFRLDPASSIHRQRRAFSSVVAYPQSTTTTTTRFIGIIAPASATIPVHHFFTPRPSASTAYRYNTATTRRRQRSPAIAVCVPSFASTSTSTSNCLLSFRTLGTSAGGGKTNLESNDSQNPNGHERLSRSASPAFAANEVEGESASPSTTNAGVSSSNSSNNNSSSSSSTSDPSMVTWVDDYLPPSLRPYAHLSRMDKPIGTWLLLWPCYWSAAMAAGVPGNTTTTINTTMNTTTTTTTLLDVLPDPKLLGLFTVGAFVMRGAGCTINDLWDRDLDRRVTRTKTRPLAAGVLTPPKAVAWLAVQLSAGLGVLLSLQPHTEYCFWWGAASLPIVVAYPLMKRCFDYPQLVLGLCFNWGAFMGWAAVHGSMDYGIVLPLYASGVAWTIGYDTLYAHQDKVDDAKLGLRSTAITFGRLGGGNGNGDDHNHEHENGGGGDGGGKDDSSRHKRVLHGLAATTYASWLLAGYNDLVATTVAAAESTEQLQLQWQWQSELLPFEVYAVGITGAYAHLVWQIRTADLNDPHNLAERFRSNAGVGGIVFGSILAGKAALLL